MSEKNYWLVPKKEGKDLMSLIEWCGYYVGGKIREEYAGKCYYLVKEGEREICKIPTSDGGQERITGKPIICYDPFDAERMESSLDLRQVFIDNNQPYEEEPLVLEVVEQLRNSAKRFNKLADRLEGKA